MSQPSLTLPAPGQQAGRGRRLLELLGAAAIAATFIFLVLTQPADIAGGLASGSTLVALGGFLLGAVLLIVGVLPTLPTSTVVLIPVALVLNIVLGQLMGTSGLPFYFDAIGTVLIAVLAGPAAGAATGALSSIVWSFINPTVLPFAAGAALIGFLAGTGRPLRAVPPLLPRPGGRFCHRHPGRRRLRTHRGLRLRRNVRRRNRRDRQRLPRHGRHAAGRHHQAGADFRPHGQGHRVHRRRPAGVRPAAPHHASSSRSCARFNVLAGKKPGQRRDA